MRRHALRLLVALLTFTCGVAAPLVRLQLGRLMTAVPAPERQLTNTAPCFPTAAQGESVSALCTHTYFPPEKFGLGDKRATERELNYKLMRYSAHLALMNEPSLLSFDDCEGEVYRFMWLRRLAEPVAVRLWRVGDKQFLAVKRLGVANACWVEGLRLDGSVRAQVRPLSAEEWTRFVVLLNESAYWSRPAFEERTGPPSWNLNDAEWVLEGVKDCRYYVVDRSAPGGDIGAAGRYLIKLSGVEAAPDLVY